MFYSFIWPCIAAVHANNFSMKEEMLEDMRESDDETQKYIDIFTEHLAKGKKEFLERKKKGGKEE